MATVRDIVTKAFRKLSVAGVNSPVTAEEMDEGVDALNSMIKAWKLRAVDLSWTDQAASDTFALDGEYHEGVIYLLASRLSPDYVAPAGFDADDWFRTFQAANQTPPSLTVPPAISSWAKGK